MNRKAMLSLFLTAASAAMIFGQTLAPPLEGAPSSRSSDGDLRILSLDEVIQGAAANRPLINQALADIAAARSRVGEARDAYVPSINGIASWQHAIPRQQEEAGATLVDLTPTEYWELGVGASAQVYDFGKRGFQVRIAQEGLRAAELNLSQIKSSLVYRAVQAFFALVFLKEEIASLDSQRQDLASHLAIVQTRVQSGSATKYDALTTQIRLTSLDGQKTEALRQQRRQQLALAQLIGAPLTARIDVRGSLTTDTVADDGTDLVVRALAMRTEVALAESDSTRAALGAQETGLAWVPTLNASASAGIKNPILTVDNSSLNTPIFNWSVGLSLNVPLGNALILKNQLEEARSRLDAARQNVLAVKENISLQVASADEDFRASLSALENAQEQLDESVQALEAARTRFELGTITNDVYLDSQLSCEQAQLAALAALYHRVSREYALNEQMGKIIWNPKE